MVYFLQKPLVPKQDKGIVSIGLGSTRLGDIDLELVLCQGIVVEHADRLLDLDLRVAPGNFYNLACTWALISLKARPRARTSAGERLRIGAKPARSGTACVSSQVRHGRGSVQARAIASVNGVPRESLRMAPDLGRVRRLRKMARLAGAGRPR